MTEEMTVIVKQGQEMAANVRQVGAVVQAMAGAMAELRGELAQLRAQVAQLEKVTPMQARALNLAIQERARVLSIQYAIGDPAPLRTAIRRALRMETGVRSTKDLARCDYQVAMEIVETWDEPGTVRELCKDDN